MTLSPSSQKLYEKYLASVIQRGLEAVAIDYKDREPERLGATEGFEACRGKSIKEIEALLVEASRAISRATIETPDDLAAYWRANCKMLEIDFVLQRMRVVELLSEEASKILTASATAT